MKKIFTICMLLMTMVVGANAEKTLDDGIRFYMSVESFTQSGKAGGVVEFKVDKDFKATLTLPNTTTYLYSGKLVITTDIKDVEGLGIRGQKENVKTIETSCDDAFLLKDKLEHLYTFTGEKTFTVKLGNLNDVKFTVKAVGGSNVKDRVITITPEGENKSYAQAVWSAITKNISTTSCGDKTNMIAEGSYINNGLVKPVKPENYEYYHDYCFFVKNATFNDDNSLRSNVNEYLNSGMTNKTESTHEIKFTPVDGFEALVKAGSYFSMGGTKLELMNDCRITSDIAPICDDGGDGLLTLIQYDLNKLKDISDDNVFKEKYVNKLFNYLHLLDKVDIDGKYIKFTFLTGIETITKSQNSAVASYVAQNNLDFSKSDYNAYICTKTDFTNGKVTLKKVDVVRKGEAFVVRTKNGETNIQDKITVDISTDAPIYGEDENQFKGTTEAKYASVIEKEKHADVYCLRTDGKFAQVKGFVEIPANKAYLLDIYLSAKETLTLDFGDGTSTAISSVNADMQPANGVAYNLAGQRVNANAKGIVIINGKKYLNK